MQNKISNSAENISKKMEKLTDDYYIITSGFNKFILLYRLKDKFVIDTEEYDEIVFNERYNYFKVMKDNLYGIVVISKYCVNYIMRIDCKYTNVILLESQKEDDIILKCTKQDNSYDMNLFLFPEIYYLFKELDKTMIPKHTNLFYFLISNCMNFYLEIPYLFITQQEVMCIYNYLLKELKIIKGITYNNAQNSKNCKGVYLDDNFILPDGRIISLNDFDEEVVFVNAGSIKEKVKVITRNHATFKYSLYILDSDLINSYRNYDYIEEKDPYTILYTSDKVVIQILDTIVYEFNYENSSYTINQNKKNLNITVDNTKTSIKFLSDANMNYFVNNELFLNNVKVNNLFIKKQKITEFIDLYYCVDCHFLVYSYPNFSFNRKISRIFKTSNDIDFRLMRDCSRLDLIKYIQANFTNELFNDFINSNIFNFLCNNNLLSNSLNNDYTYFENDFSRITLEKDKVVILLKVDNVTSSDIELDTELYNKIGIEEITKYFETIFTSIESFFIISAIFN